MSESESELSNDPGSESAEEEASDEEREREETYNDYLKDSKQAIADVTRTLAGLDRGTFMSADLDAAQNSRVVPPAAVVVPGGDSDSELDQMDKNLDEVLQDLRRPNPQRPGDDPTQRQQWNTQRFIAAFGGLVVVATLIGVLYVIIKDAIQNKDDTDVPLPPDTKKKIRALVKKWWGQSDTDFWNSFATTVTDPVQSITVADQILFMNYVINLSPIAPWTWTSSDDVVAVVKELLDAYAAGGSQTSAMYKLAPTLKDPHPRDGQPETLIRPVAATVLRYALTDILVNDKSSAITLLSEFTEFSELTELTELTELD